VTSPLPSPSAAPLLAVAIALCLHSPRALAILLSYRRRRRPPPLEITVALSDLPPLLEIDVSPLQLSQPVVIPSSRPAPSRTDAVVDWASEVCGHLVWFLAFIGALLIIFLQFPQCQVMRIFNQTNFSNVVPRVEADHRTRWKDTHVQGNSIQFLPRLICIEPYSFLWNLYHGPPEANWSLHKSSWSFIIYLTFTVLVLNVTPHFL
jgi:hypothetical protein